MKTRKHVHKEEFATPTERLFELLITPSSIRQWWNAARVIVIPEKGGTWTAAWGDDEDDPDYVSAARIRAYEPPHRIVFGDYHHHAKDGPLPFDAEFVTEFAVSAIPNGASLEVTQDGFPALPEADDFYCACQNGWAETFAGIRRLLDDSE
jgi:uncharacterized protein YndB with AHSA1/START domain